MTKHTLIIVHGMGSYSEGEFKGEVVEALKDAYGLYEGFESRNPTKEINIVEFNYDDIFENYRNRIANDASSVASVLGAIPHQTNISAISSRLTGYITKFSSDEFFYTHWLDVLFYRYTLLGELVRLRLGVLLTKILKDNSALNVSIMGHSLGTSIVHDTLAKLYSNRGKWHQASYNDANEKPEHLSISDNKLKSVTMVANVSRLLETPEIARVENSVVRPKTGCTNTFQEFRHKFDPFTYPKPFNPPDELPWSNRFAYKLVTPTGVTQLNTHGIKSYLLNPKCHLKLLKYADPNFTPSDVVKAKAKQKYADMTAEGRAQQVAAAARQIDLRHPDTIEGFISALKDFKDFLDEFGG